MANRGQLLCVGNFTVDELVGGVLPGGSVFYSGSTAHALGVSPRIVAASGDDFPLKSVQDAFPFELSRVSSKQTTRMRNTYRDGNRTQFLVHRGGPVGWSAVPDSWKSTELVLLCPVFGEVERDLASSLRGRVTGASLQGWLRTVGPGNEVIPSHDLSFLTDLVGVDVFFLSDEDVRGRREMINEFRKIAPLVVETRGPEGAILYGRHSIHTVPGVPVTGVDPTGAGDTFAAAFLVFFQADANPVVAARKACAVAALEVQQVGPLTRRMVEAARTALDTQPSNGEAEPGGETNHD